MASKQKEYVLSCSTMTCGGCEGTVQNAILALNDKNILSVKASAQGKTVTVTTNGCNSCANCQCCKCNPCTCNPCRCCSCGVDKYISAIDAAGHTATYKTKGSGCACGTNCQCCKCNPCTCNPCQCCKCPKVGGSVQKPQEISQLLGDGAVKIFKAFENPRAAMASTFTMPQLLIVGAICFAAGIAIGKKQK